MKLEVFFVVVLKSDALRKRKESFMKSLMSTCCFSISDQHIASISFNRTGDWIALGCGGMGQLLVWEWQSESYVLKQQGHFNNMTCLAYSPDGQHIVTGGDDAKVRD